MEEEIAKRNIENVNTAWRDSSQYITLSAGEETTLRFHPYENDGMIVKQDTFQGQLSGYKTFYKVVDVSRTNTDMRTFKANRKSSKLINKELSEGHYVLRIKRIGDGKDTLYQPIPVAK